jgi:flagellar protein FlaJ
LKRLRDYTSRALDIASTPIKTLLKSYTSTVRDFDAYVIGSGISTSYESYIERASQAILIALIVSATLIFIALSRSLPLLLAIAVAIASTLFVALPLSMALAIYIPITLYKNRGEVIESKAIELLTALSLLIASGQTFYRVLESLPRVLGRDYKFFSIEIDLATSLLRVGTPIADALRRVAKVTPSPTLRELFLSLSSIIGAGGNIVQIVWSLTERYVTRYSIRIERSAESLNTYMEIYVAIALLIPSLIGSMAALALIAPIAGISFEALLTLTTLILVPVASIAIVVLADVIVSRVRP